MGYWPTYTPMEVNLSEQVSIPANATHRPKWMSANRLQRRSNIRSICCVCWDILCNWIKNLRSNIPNNMWIFVYKIFTVLLPRKWQNNIYNFVFICSVVQSQKALWGFIKYISLDYFSKWVKFNLLSDLNHISNCHNLLWAANLSSSEPPREGHLAIPKNVISYTN